MRFALLAAALLLAACDDKPAPAKNDHGAGWLPPAGEDKGWLQRNAEICGEGYIIIAHGGFEVCVPYKLPNEAM